MNLSLKGLESYLETLCLDSFNPDSRSQKPCIKRQTSPTLISFWKCKNLGGLICAITHLRSEPLGGKLIIPLSSFFI